jgi:mitochondrial ATPase complex subunit ATP10
VKKFKMMCPERLPTVEAGLLNRHIGFVYLVDENVKVRWAACGLAHKEERASLRGCIRELLERLEKKYQK